MGWTLVSCAFLAVSLLPDGAKVHHGAVGVREGDRDFLEALLEVLFLQTDGQWKRDMLEDFNAMEGLNEFLSIGNFFWVKILMETFGLVCLRIECVAYATQDSLHQFGRIKGGCRGPPSC